MPVDWDRLKKANIDSAISVMESAGLDALLVTGLDNVRYLTAERLYYQMDWYVDFYAALLTSDGQLTKWTFDLYGAGPFGWESYPIAPPPLLAERWAELFDKALDGHGLHSGRVGLDSMSFIMHDELKKRMPRVVLVAAAEQLLKARAVKNEQEIELMRESARIVDAGLEAGLEMMKPGVKENEVYGEILKATQEAGSEGPPFFGCCTSGSRTLESLLATDRKLRNGDLVIIDVGSIFGGYCGDSSRTGIVGEADIQMQELYRTLLDAHMAGIKAVRPGVNASGIDRAVRKVLEETGYPDYPASSGHGIGLRVVELPWITTHEEAGSFDLELRPGMIFCLEPTTYVRGEMAARIESEILVTDSGHELLTKTRFYEF
jgi:Xaa-Pro aminopeptidase